MLIKPAECPATSMITLKQFRLWLLALGILFACAMGIVFLVVEERQRRLAHKIEAVSLLSSGQPVDKLQRAGFKPFYSQSVYYDNEECTLRYYRSSGTHGLEQSDFIVVSNGRGIIVVAFEYFPGEQAGFLKSIGAELP